MNVIFTKKIYVTLLCLLFFTSLFGQTTYTDKVTTTKDNEPLIGVQVSIKGTSRGTVTDLNGTYKISAKPGEVMLIAYLGFTTKEIRLTANQNINVMLDESITERSRELCYEGQRWFDLARTGRLINAVKTTVLSTGTFTGSANISAKHYLFPIPQNEIDNNSKIENSDQNPGY